MPRRKKTRNCQMEAAGSRSQEINSNEEAPSASKEDDIDLKQFLFNTSFQGLSSTDTEQRPESADDMVVSDIEESESDQSFSVLSPSLNTSSADTVLVSQNSQPPLEVEVKEEE